MDRRTADGVKSDKPKKAPSKRAAPSKKAPSKRAATRGHCQHTVDLRSKEPGGFVRNLSVPDHLCTRCEQRMWMCPTCQHWYVRKPNANREHLRRCPGLKATKTSSASSPPRSKKHEPTAAGTLTTDHAIREPECVSRTANGWAFKALSLFAPHVLRDRAHVVQVTLELLRSVEKRPGVGLIVKYVRCPIN